MFVWDQKRKLLVLPMVLSSVKKAKNCTVQYDDAGKEISRNCWDNDLVDTQFAGLKAIEVDLDKGIYEKYSYNFLERLIASMKEDMRKDGDFYEDEEWDKTFYPWQFTQLHFRVGYLGDVLYTLNNLFAHFAIMGDGQEKFIDFE